MLRWRYLEAFAQRHDLPLKPATWALWVTLATCFCLSGVYGMRGVGDWDRESTPPRNPQQLNRGVSGGDNVPSSMSSSPMHHAVDYSQQPREPSPSHNYEALGRNRLSQERVEHGHAFIAPLTPLSRGCSSAVQAGPFHWPPFPTSQRQSTSAVPHPPLPGLGYEPRSQDLRPLGEEYVAFGRWGASGQVAGARVYEAPPASRGGVNQPHARRSTGDEEQPSRPPLVVTIGPQCAGKTTMLATLGRSLSERGTAPLQDIAIDDSSGVYCKIPLQLLLEDPWLQAENVWSGDMAAVVYGRPLRERLMDDACRETRLVAMRLLGHLSEEEFSSSVADLFLGSGNELNSQWTEAVPRGRGAVAALTSAVEACRRDGPRATTPTADVFVREAVWPRAVAESKQRLRGALREHMGVVAWGNTNTKARDFQDALSMAEAMGRPVRFLRWGRELEAVGLDELARRNVARFSVTGRYIGLNVIAMALERSEQLLRSTAGGDSQQLALAAGFAMDEDGYVTCIRNRLMPGMDGFHGQGQGPGRGQGGQQGRGSGRRGGRGGAQPRGRGGGQGRKPGPGRYGSWRSSGGFHRDRAGAGSATGGRETWGGTAEGWGEKAPLSGPGAVTSPGACSRRQGVQPSMSSRLRDNGGLAVVGAGWGGRGGAGGTGECLIPKDHDMAATATAPPFVMFAKEWGRKREWRHDFYSDEDLDPWMSGVMFPVPANSTGRPKRTDIFDYEAFDLVRRIKDFRAKR
ncbi:unnamed protein product [Discosporangium mesarthrocarpum]